MLCGMIERMMQHWKVVAGVIISERMTRSCGMIEWVVQYWKVVSGILFSERMMGSCGTNEWMMKVGAGVLILERMTGRVWQRG